MVRLLCVVVLLVAIQQNDSSRILGVFPTASLRHQTVFKTLCYELARKGHQVILVTTNPGDKNKPKENITEIDTSYMYKIFDTVNEAKRAKTGTLYDFDLILPEELNVLEYFVENTLKNPELKALYKDNTTKFDLLITESLYYAPLGLAKVFDVPAIWFSSMYGTPGNYEVVGAPSRHPVFYPFFFRNRLNSLSTWDKVKEVFCEIRTYIVDKFVTNFELKLAREVFEDDSLTLEDLTDHVDFLFVNAHKIFDGNRPVPPNVIFLGALHLQPPQKLPEDYKSMLDNSKRGVVYTSLGTNVMQMDCDLLEAFLKAFEKLPYDVLWKYDGDKLPWLPKNVHIQKWFPQRDLLLHPKVKAFVMQGGLQSTDEAIDAGVPLVVIPALGDQWYNAERFEEFGIGIKLDILTLEADHIVDSINKVINDKSYRDSIKRLKNLMIDKSKSPLETAVWWTEYAIRHKGGKHLRSDTANVSWFEYLMLDVVGSAILFLVISIYLTVKIVKMLFRLIVRSIVSAYRKVKQN